MNQNADRDWKRALAKLENPYFRARSRYTRHLKKLTLDEHLILLESQQGGELSGNIFYLLRYLAQDEKYREYRLLLSAREGKQRQFRAMLKDRGWESRVELVVLSSEPYFRALATAKYLINDNTFLPFWIKREGQVYLNTWHGTPLKSLGKAIKNDFHAIGNTQKNFIEADYLLYPNMYTMDHIVQDYMLENLATGTCLLGGYPRNEIFFDPEARERVRRAAALEDKRVYAYMPTFRGTARSPGSVKANAYMVCYLDALDQALQEDEILYVNLHPVQKKDIPFEALFRHIRPFPEQYETYEFLTAADCLITDYSSVFFDFANTRRKIVLFPYDEADYLADRGTYLDIRELPFPRVYNVEDLLNELRSEKNYDDQPFLARFAPWEGKEASQRLCDCTILGMNTGLDRRPVPDNQKPNVLIYAGNLAGNGVTASLRNLLSTTDLDGRNYYLTFLSDKLGGYRDNVLTFPQQVGYVASNDDMDLTIGQRFFRKLFKCRLLSAGMYVAGMKRAIKMDWLRCYGHARFDSVIQFNGYEPEVILQFSQFEGNRVIYVHSDMSQEIRLRGNQRRDVLRYAYRHFSRVALVTQDIWQSTRSLAGTDRNFCHTPNLIDRKGILEKSILPVTLDPETRLNMPEQQFLGLLAAPGRCFVSNGRFSPEKGQDRLIRAFSRLLQEEPSTKLVILGGSSFEDTYDRLCGLVKELGLDDRVALIQQVSNPFAIMKACDYFVLSSYYEGFGLVLAEADILGKPLISTDITGPRTFLQAHGGTLVEDSEEGLYQGMKRLLAGEIAPMQVDYDAYNQDAMKQFEALLTP